MSTYEAMPFYLMMCVIQIDYRSFATGKKFLNSVPFGSITCIYDEHKFIQMIFICFTVYQGDKETDLEINLTINLDILTENVVNSRTSKGNFNLGYFNQQLNLL